MLSSDRLPNFTFVTASGCDHTMRPADRLGRIHALAQAVRAQVPAGSVVGLMFPSGPELVLGWLGCVVAGMQPLVMQYPTAKQTRQYWEEQVANTVATAEVKLVLCDCPSAARGLDRLVPVLTQETLDGLPDQPALTFTVAGFAVVQLSSGTTGHRKAMRLEGAALLRHVTEFNDVLMLASTDRIVSWLPLYHDMGFVACFIMPLLLGVDVVMMDPVVWVQSPGLLFDAIVRHQGTVCYMPNFGFEVMASAEPRPMPSMRLWVSCSEPVSASTAERFLGATGAPAESFAACYAMAENVFAVSLARGVTVRRIEGADVVSCGAPIPGVQLRLVDGQIWVRSPAAIASYLGGADIRDADGFYPTGDLGELQDGALYVTGRQGDVLIQAGRKFMLSDLDLTLNRLFPDIRGRAACIARDDLRLGTQVAVALIETAEFITRHDQADVAAALRAASGLDQIEVAFVPPRFLTKTSSGKINRKICAAHWAGVLAHRAEAQAQADPLAELAAAFPRVARDRPVAEVLDSLSLTVLRIILGGAGVAYDGGRTLGETASLLGQQNAAGTEETGLRIVSLADLRTVARVSERHLDVLSRRLGCPVSFEHVCLPPSPVLLSDLVFDAYFSPRIDQAAMSAMRTAFARLHGASVILIDDGAELRLPPNQAYAPLSHSLERDPNADLITVRWQSYARQHHKLPTSFASGRDLALEDRAATIPLLAAFLAKPVFRIAAHPGLAAYTAGWEYTARPGTADAPLAPGIMDPGRLIDALAGWMEGLPVPPAKVELPRAARLDTADLGHFCSHFANRRAIDILLASYASFCIAGQDSSIPYIRQALARARKPYVCVPSYAPEILRTVDLAYECLLICGAWGDFPVTTPGGAIMFTGNSAAVTFNMADPALAKLVFKRNSAADPASATDWFYPAKLHRDWDISVWTRLRVEAPEPGRVKPRPLRALLERARTARESGRLDEARDLAAEVVAADPGCLAGYRMLATVDARRGDREVLVRTCEVARARFPDQAEVFDRIVARAGR